MWISAGVAAQALGILCLRRSQSRTSGGAALLALGLGCLAAAVALMARALGAELGMAWGLVTISLVAYALILPPFFMTTGVGHERVPRRLKAMPASLSGSAARLAVRLFSAGPLYLVTALALSLLIATKPWAGEISRLYTGGLITPVFWSLGALHATVDRQLSRVVLLPVCLTGAAAAVYVLT